MMKICKGVQFLTALGKERFEPARTSAWQQPEQLGSACTHASSDESREANRLLGMMINQQRSQSSASPSEQLQEIPIKATRRSSGTGFVLAGSSTCAEPLVIDVQHRV